MSEGNPDSIFKCHIGLSYRTNFMMSEEGMVGYKVWNFPPNSVLQQCISRKMEFALEVEVEKT